MDIQLVFGFTILICLWVPFAVIGAGILLYPHKAIENANKMAQLFPGYNPNNYPNIHGGRMVLLYRVVGMGFIIIMGLPIVILLLALLGLF